MEVLVVVAEVNFVSGKDEAPLSRLSLSKQGECLVKAGQHLVRMGHELPVLNQPASAALGDDAIDAQKQKQNNKG